MDPQTHRRAIDDATLQRQPLWQRLMVVVLALTLLALTLAGIWSHQRIMAPAHHMRLLPMIGGLDSCLQNPNAPSLPDSCRGPGGSAAALVLSTLDRMAGTGARQAVSPTSWPLGYTLKLPLLALLSRDADGGWRPDQAAINRVASTVRNTPRPVLIYLFSTHFGVGGDAEKQLAQEIENLAATPDGPLGPDSYYGTPIIPWSVASTSNSVTRAREQVIRAVADTLCRETPSVRQRIVGVSLLGEVHQLFPRFETGMGLDLPYRVSDYSRVSVEGFQRYLATKYGDIAAFNRAMGTNMPSFSSVAPPAKDMRVDAQATPLEHLDSFAAGTVPVSGWTSPQDNTLKPGDVEIFLNGRSLGLARTGLGRQDVATAHPELPTANVGWRFDLRFDTLPAGTHRIDAFWRTDQAARVHLGTRRIRVGLGSAQTSSAPIDEVALPPSTPQDERLAGYIDHPPNGFRFIFNPLAVDWHQFRAEQVARYVTHIASALDNTCLQNTPRFTHQIVPSGNPSWDSGKFAVERTLPPPTPLMMGVSLYGESSYGPSFSAWHASHGHGAYGVTEFHPLRGLSTSELREVLEAHERQGAQFVSFFMEAEHQGQRLNAMQNPFALAPDNPRYGSDTTYRSLHNLLKP